MTARIFPPCFTFEQALRRGLTGEIRMAGYLDWIRSLPCDVCGKPPRSEASHPNFFKSQRRKGPDPLALPECGPFGCHEAYERNGAPDEQRRLARAALYMLQAIHEGKLVWKP